MSDWLKLGDALGLRSFDLYLAESLVETHFAHSEAAFSWRYLILHAAVQASSGHIRTDLETLSKDMTTWYCGSDLPTGIELDESLPDRVAGELDSLISLGLESGLIGRLESETASVDSLSLPRPPMVLSADGRFLYFLKRRRHEDRIIHLIEDRSSAVEGSEHFPLPAKLPDEPAGELMAKLAQGHRLLILAGGPGTGKTSTVARLLSLLSQGRRQQGLPPASILPAAPTGRAAARMTESLLAVMEDDSVPQGRTIHSLLGLSPGRKPLHDRDNPLDASLVVVDEASMVDLSLMLSLLDALPPAAALLLVGDPDQLPSVEAGSLLGDLLAGVQEESRASGPLADSIVRLTKVYRSSSDILDSAGMIRRGDYPGLMHSSRTGSVKIHQLLSARETALLLADVYKDSVESSIASAEQGDYDGVFSPFGKQAVLTPLRKGPWGVPALNAGVSQLISGGQAPFPGMPVMVTQNDPVRNLWNGDRGVVIRHADGLRVLFPDIEGSRIFPLAALPAWEPAWIQTIHKSQGSEFDGVLILLPDGAEKLLTREILYTAFTRARSFVTLYADTGTIEASLAAGVVRNSRVRGWAAGS